ncbi:acyl-CoA dehydrogenase [Frankia torreyi]|uniref:Acyl-CoA dehydrogenase n=1 Tax=Frankia torreyi TaxID=1856 RepID=A0A0D8BDX3_9ACTN|nr:MULTISPECIES: acyl-CoA dehydrogenase family protein [unclassified Frankia]KJE22468.1 acyl-CoA dehydrogenase [Frankia torreyi]KQC38243.1 acyl-CoA dehydrogenase [Frankia sp. ACN1ag]KQM04506.1 acyl-CoA dehydrogenase [Frankia sp. CpI1-P]
MQFRYSPEHDELRRGIRRYFAEVADADAVRRDMATPTGWDPVTWQRLCDELELPALAVPEEYGGAGFGLVELGIALSEAGRSLLCAPLLSTSFATQALLHAGDADAAAAHLPGLAAGTTTGTLAAREPGRAWDATPTTTAERAGDGWALTGVKDWVLDGQSAGLFVVTATTAAGTSLFLVDAGAAGLAVEALPVVDPTRRVTRVTLTGTPGVLLGADGAGAPGLARTLDAAVTLLAAEQLGVAEAALASAVDYAKQREQFGRPIGSFQAIKHKLATVLLEVEAATSAVMYAAWTADESPAELPEVASIAGLTCSEAALLAAGENVQVHGGIGFTWEHSAHLYLKRATTDRLLLRDPQHQLDRIAALAGITAQAPDAPAPAEPAGAASPDVLAGSTER